MNYDVVEYANLANEEGRDNFKIEHTEIYGLNKAMIASGNPMRTEMSDNTREPSTKDLSRSIALGTTKSGEGHDQYLTGIIVQFDIYAPLYMWKEIQRYHFLDFISSQSTMHKLTKFNVASKCNPYVDDEILERYQFLLDEYNNLPEDTLQAVKTNKWKTLVASLPSGFILGATLTTNYRQLKTMYQQRKNHKLIEWHWCCEWCEKLPRFLELCFKKEED
jgi:hypothetical protein